MCPPSHRSSSSSSGRGRGRHTKAALARLLGLGLVATLALGLGPDLARAGHGDVVPVLTVEYVQTQYQKGRRMTPIDLRSQEEYEKGRLPKAQSLPLLQLASRFQEIPKADLVVLYCDCPQADLELAYWFLRRHQYRNLSVLGSGFKSWVERGLPVER